MNWKSLLAVTAALLLAVLVPAQDNCPRTKAVTVPGSVSYGPVVNCAGLSYSVPGLTLQTATGCPLFATLIPDHEIAEATRDRTMVRVNATVPGKMVFFQCRTSYLIFIPLGSTCVFDREFNFGSYMRMTTVGCPDQP
jgi:hypothetical protein